MKNREFHYRWEWMLHATPEVLWPFVSDTNRFNHDAGVPAVERVRDESKGSSHHRLRLYLKGLPVEWDEAPFEWVRPHRFGVIRHYFRGPIAELRMLAELFPESDQKTRLVYQVWAKARNLIGASIIPIQIGIISARKFASTFHQFEELATHHKLSLPSSDPVRFASGGGQRLATMKATLLEKNISKDLVDLLIKSIEQDDDLMVARMRPYILADQWNVKRRSVLELFLHATRAGLLDFRWDLLCPLCRGAKQTASTLSEIKSETHCDTCNINYQVDFDRSVELTFRPNPSVRIIQNREFCIGGPQVTPHIVVQQILLPNSEKTISLTLEEGRYRFRTLDSLDGPPIIITKNGKNEITLEATRSGLARDEIQLATSSTIRFKNVGEHEQLFIIEHTTWSDQAVTAAEVTELQIFRDLFSSEALRPGEEISVGSVTILFTDLRHSTRLYREIGDAPAFGRVMNHFDILKQVIVAEDGAIVKTIGDAVMAVFRHPVAAIRSVFEAQRLLNAQEKDKTPLILKAGVHCGRCIAVNLNSRLDYFGSTINIAARLESLSKGGDIIISAAVKEDHEVFEFLELAKGRLLIEPIEATLKGYETERFQLWHVKPLL